MAIIVISSELPEVVGTADRVLVMREGEIVERTRRPPGRSITQESIIELATGAGSGPAEPPARGGG